jgi:hypothetical protein
MANCGNTGAIPDCLEAQDSIWTLSYNIPRPGIIRYKYPNENWQEIVMNSDALDYRFVTVPAQPGQCLVPYRIRAWGQGPVYVASSGTDISSGTYYPGYDSLNNVATIMGPISKVEMIFNTPAPTKADFPSGGRNVQLKVTHAEGIFLANCSTYTQPNLVGTIALASSQYFAFIEIQNIQFIRRDGQADNCGAQCKFEVFDTQNNIVFTRTDAVCPDVEKIPCQLYPEDEKKIQIKPENISFGQFLKGLLVNPTFTLDGVRGTKVEIVAYPIPNLPSRLTVLDLYSSKGCNIHPKVCWECKPCEKCPKNTCLKVLDRSRNKICCYGPNGKVIATVDPNCETADC